MTADQVAPWLAPTQEFVSAIEILISKLLEGAAQQPESRISWRVVKA